VWNLGGADSPPLQDAVAPSHLPPLQLLFQDPGTAVGNCALIVAFFFCLGVLFKQVNLINLLKCIPTQKTAKDSPIPAFSFNY